MRLLQWQRLFLGCSLQCANVFALSHSQRLLARSIDNGGLQEVDEGDTSIGTSAGTSADHSVDTSIDRPHNRKPCNATGTHAEGARRYLVDNSALQAKTRGVGFRFSKALKDVDVDTVAAWGSSVFGREQADGWLQVEDCFLPMQLKGTPVLLAMDGQSEESTLKPAELQQQQQEATVEQSHDSNQEAAQAQDEATYLVEKSQPSRRCNLSATVSSARPARQYFLDNSRLQAKTKGVGYRFSTSITDVDVDTVAPWGVNVRGYDAGEGWIQVGDCYLPKMLKGLQVAIPEEETPEAKRIAELQVEVARMQAEAARALSELKNAKSVTEASVAVAAESREALAKAREAVDRAEKDAKLKNQTLAERTAELDAERNASHELKVLQSQVQWIQHQMKAEAQKAAIARAALEEDIKLKNQTLVQQTAEIGALRAAAANGSVASTAQKALQDALQAEQSQVQWIQHQMKAEAQKAAIARAALEEDIKLKNQTLAQQTAEIGALQAAAANGSVASRAQKALQDALQALEAERQQARGIRQQAQDDKRAAEAAHAALAEARKEVELKNRTLAERIAELDAARRAAWNATHELKAHQVKERFDQDLARQELSRRSHTLKQQAAELDALRAAAANATAALKAQKALEAALQAEQQQEQWIRHQMQEDRGIAEAAHEALKAAQKALAEQTSKVKTLALEVEQLRVAAASNASAAAAAKEALEEAQKPAKAKRPEYEPVLAGVHELEELRKSAAANATAVASAKQELKAALRTLEQQRQAQEAQAREVARVTAEYQRLKAMATSDASAAGAAREALEEARQAQHRQLREAVSQALRNSSAEIDELRRAVAGNATAAAAAREALEEARKAAAAEAQQVAKLAADVSTLRESLAKRSAEAVSQREAAEAAKKEKSAAYKAVAERVAELTETLASTRQAADVNMAAATERISELMDKQKEANKAYVKISNALRDCENNTAVAKAQFAERLAESSATTAAAAERIQELEKQLRQEREALPDDATKTAVQRVAVLEQELKRERILAAESTDRLKVSEGKNGELLAQLQDQQKELTAVATGSADRVRALQAELQAAQKAAEQAMQLTTQQASHISGLQGEVLQWKQLAEELRAKGDASALAAVAGQAAEARAQALKAELERHQKLLGEASEGLQKEAARVAELQTALDWLRRSLEQAQAKKAAIEAQNKDLVRKLQGHMVESAAKEEQQRRQLAQIVAEKDAGAHRLQDLEWFKDRAMRVMKELLARSRLGR